MTSTPPLMSGVSTPGFSDFPTGLTPGGFFSAAYGDNPFEESFKNNAIDVTTEPFSKSLQAPAETSSLYGFPTSNSFFNSPYPTKMEITPPHTATDPPSDWRFEDSLPEQQLAETLAQHLADAPNPKVKIQFGQATPPDEPGLRAPELDEITSALHNQGRQHMVKRESSSSNRSSKSMKRAKKSGRASQANLSDENGEEVEKRSKFLERNRVAASKCRQKKKEHNAALESRAKQLERDNAFLKMTIENMQNEKISLMTQMAAHEPGACDCHEIHQHLANFKAKYTSTGSPFNDDMTGEHSMPSPSTSSFHVRNDSIASSTEMRD